MTIAEIFDRAVSLLVRHWRPAATIALLSSLPAALSEVALLNDVHARFVYAALSAAAWIAFAYGFAALIAVFSGRDPVALLRDGWLRLLRTQLAGIVPVVAAAGIAATVLLVVAELTKTVSSRVFAFIALPLGILGVAATVPFMLVAMLALANAVIDGTRATKSVMTALERALARRERVRTVILALAVAATTALGKTLVGGTIESIAHATDVWWPLVLMPPLRVLVTLPYLAAIVTLAAQDYAERREGVDLDAALDGLGAA